MWIQFLEKILVVFAHFPQLLIETRISFFTDNVADRLAFVKVLLGTWNFRVIITTDVVFLVKQNVGILCLLFDDRKVRTHLFDYVIVVFKPHSCACVFDKRVVMTPLCGIALMHNKGIQVVNMIEFLLQSLGSTELRFVECKVLCIYLYLLIEV